MESVSSNLCNQRHGELERRILSIEKAIMGNGDSGIKTSVAMNTKFRESMENKIDFLAKRLLWLGVWVTLIVIGGIGFIGLVIK